eukprot:11473147-Prorocentrum_lima.AAC.1
MAAPQPGIAGSYPAFLSISRTPSHPRHLAFFPSGQTHSTVCSCQAGLAFMLLPSHPGYMTTFPPC